MGDGLMEYRDVYKILEDEESRDIYLNRVNAMISGDYKYLAKIAAAYQPSLPPSNGNHRFDHFYAKGQEVCSLWGWRICSGISALLERG